MKNILIIKVGALGDVLRTTPLLKPLQGNIVWVTSDKAAPLLLGNPDISRIYFINDLPDSLLNEQFDLVINLEEDSETAELASKLNKKSLVGAYMGEAGITYTESASEWFDMSLISRFGRKKADELKVSTRSSYQEVIFSLLGLRFQGEEYVLSTPLKKQPRAKLVGLEPRVGDVWPTKRWTKYEKLAIQLERSGFQVKFFHQRDRLEEYIEDINECETIVCGDTLAMHVGLALRKNVVGIWTCSNPHETPDYAGLYKVPSPLWERYFIRREYTPIPADAIPVEAVFNGVRVLANKNSLLKTENFQGTSARTGGA